MAPRQDDCKEELTDSAKNRIAKDGLWFQAVGQEYGMDAVFAMDRNVREQCAGIEARRIKY
jgi:hypothetical protein